MPTLFGRSHILLQAVATVTLVGGAAAVPQPTTHACAFSTPDEALTTNLAACLPAPATPEQKAAAIALLPREGEVRTINQTARGKLEGLGELLREAGRSAVYDVRVIDVPQAWAGLYARSVVLVSGAALNRLSGAELRGIVAHEIAHEYLWDDFAKAQKSSNSNRLRNLEMVCDVIAVKLLASFDNGPAALISGLEKLAAYNRTQFGTPTNASAYPTERERRSVIQRTAGILRLDSVP